MQISTVGGSTPVGGSTWGCVGADRTQPCPFASNDLLLHSGCTANLVLEFIETLSKAVQAHLSPVSLPCASFHPSWSEPKCSGPVIPSPYSYPTTLPSPSTPPWPRTSL